MINIFFDLVKLVCQTNTSSTSVWDAADVLQSAHSAPHAALAAREKNKLFQVVEMWVECEALI